MLNRHMYALFLYAPNFRSTLYNMTMVKMSLQGVLLVFETVLF